MFCRVTGASENTHLPDAVFGDLAPEERKRIVWDKKKKCTFCLSPPGQTKIGLTEARQEASMPCA